MRNLIRKISIVIFLLVLISTICNCQSYYTLDKRDKLPKYGSQNIDSVFVVINNAFLKALKTPEQIEFEPNRKILLFSEGDEGKLKISEAYIGQPYNDKYKVLIAENYLLCFNLNFDEKGLLVVPKKLFAISFKESISEFGQNIDNFIGLNITLTDYEKSVLSRFKLDCPAAVFVDETESSYKNVNVSIPFDLSYSSNNIRTHKIQVSKDEEKSTVTTFARSKHNKFSTNYSCLKYFVLKSKELEKLQNGNYEFIIEEYVLNYNVDSYTNKSFLFTNNYVGFTKTEWKIITVNKI
jgi:hypothetical protein